MRWSEKGRELGFLVEVSFLCLCFHVVETELKEKVSTNKIKESMIRLFESIVK